MSDRKRAAEEVDDEVIGPLPVSEEPSKKKQKVLQFEKTYLENVPSAAMYEKSFMHRDVVTQVLVTKTDFIITVSCDGHVKFWKKQEEGIEFVKHFRAHLGHIMDIASSYDGLYLCTVADDRSLKVFDVVNFDMINMYRLQYVPSCCVWIYASSASTPLLACAEHDKPVIHIYDGQSSDKSAVTSISHIHRSPVVSMEYNIEYDVIVSVDRSAMLEYWGGVSHDYKFPSNMQFQYKTDTDLYEFAKHKVTPTSIIFSPDGKLFAIMATDGKIRVFRFLTGKLYRVFDESIQVISEQHQISPQLQNMEFGRRLAVERELVKSTSMQFYNATFDETSNFLIYSTMLGMKVINLVTNKCVRTLGKEESVRFLNISLYQGKIQKTKGAITLEMEVSENPSLLRQSNDPVLIATGYKKNRFYLFTCREPDVSGEYERDVFNEKPSKEEQLNATEGSVAKRVTETATIHTSMGDIQIKLFVEQCPKAVENFCVHSRNGYYNGHIFHRVIKQFMIQTGDPTGTGTGGESIWGAEFEDEFHSSLKHDRPYTVSMANAGANTNGSQFFVTVVPTPWLDNKHTIFGRVVKGMETVQNISNVKTHPKTDKPYDDIKIINVTLK
ncbi:peptidylprolyl isomerase domain and WD repeat-containing protein 1-like [Dysidea avara]|uniref:peptidylprolyl isomerase domain and WD repeat-containing protein 1-like n=1 Tax=Dysidea avara TaxID=196820 RepID=UPI00332610C3